MDNGVIDYTFVYEYDDAGNLLAEKIYEITAAGATPSILYVTNSYGYSTGTWGDLLTSYKGTAITYDAIGNPLSYYNGASYTFTWKGRQLATATKGGVSYSFTYNDDGIRTSKTVGGVKHTYYVSGSQILAESWDNNLLVFLYDESGSPIGMRYRTTSYAKGVWDVYFFEKNLQGDIVAVYNSSGTKLVSYGYDDAWGYATTSYSNGGSNTGARYNPFRYRGYYYDSDLGLYYLNSRYYDANTGRFISADGYVSTGQGLLGNNMFAYCNNNPVMYKDPNGEFLSPIISILGTIGAIVNTVNDIKTSHTIDGDHVFVNQNVKIEGSNSITTPWVIYGYSFYLNHFREDTKNVIQGRTFGLSYEWALHNFAALLGIGGKQATSLDVGASIFADGRDHNFEKSRPEVALMSIAMRASYMIITSPLIWIRDMRINGGF